MGDAAGIFKAFYNPVNVGGEVFFDKKGSNLAARHKALMANDHAASKAFPGEGFGQFLGGDLGTGADVPAVVVHEHNFAKKDVGIGSYSGDDFFDGFGVKNAVAGIHKPDEIAGRHFQTLIHGVVKAAVGFAYPSVNLVLVLANEVGGSVGGGAVHDDVFDIGVGLFKNTVHGAFE